MKQVWDFTVGRANKNQAREKTLSVSLLELGLVEPKTNMED